MVGKERLSDLAPLCRGCLQSSAKEWASLCLNFLQQAHVRRLDLEDNLVAVLLPDP